MLYYKVKPESDQFVIDKKHNFLIANELYTVREFEKIRYNYMKRGRGSAKLKECFTIIDIPKNKTYFFFGARFAEDNT